MSKILIVEDCCECKHFDMSDLGNFELCAKLGRYIEQDMGTGHFFIPDDCPLPDWDASIEALIERLERLK